jgi:hypothetical protein
MGCNCKVTKKIALINKKYGSNPPQKQTNISGLIKDKLVLGIVILFLPFIFLHVLYVYLFKKDKKITFSEMFGKKKVKNV